MAIISFPPGFSSLHSETSTRTASSPLNINSGRLSACDLANDDVDLSAAQVAIVVAAAAAARIGMFDGVTDDDVYVRHKLVTAASAYVDSSNIDVAALDF